MNNKRIDFDSIEDENLCTLLIRKVQEATDAGDEVKFNMIIRFYQLYTDFTKLHNSLIFLGENQGREWKNV